MQHTTLWTCIHIPNIIDLSGKTKKLWSGQASLRTCRRKKIRLKQYVSLRSKGRHNTFIVYRWMKLWNSLFLMVSNSLKLDKKQTLLIFFKKVCFLRWDQFYLKSNVKTINTTQALVNFWPTSFIYTMNVLSNIGNLNHIRHNTVLLLY